MLSILRNAWKVPELKKRFIWTIFLVAASGIRTHTPVPRISTNVLKDLASSGTIFGFYDLLSDGAPRQFSMFVLSIAPYISASIVVQLLTIAIPSLEQLSKKGKEGRRRVQKVTRILLIVIGFILAFGTYSMVVVKGTAVGMQWVGVPVALVASVVGSTFCMWLGDQITAKGLGNGVSILIFVNIVSQLLITLMSLFTLKDQEKTVIVEILLFVVFAIVLLGVVILLSLTERRASVQYAGKAVGNKVTRRQSIHIPLSIVESVVIAIIFATSVIMSLKTIVESFPNCDWVVWVTSNKCSISNEKTWMYLVAYSALTIFFIWFYVQVTFRPDEMVENLHRSAGFVPGIRPGDAAGKYFERVPTKVPLVGGVFAVLLAILPILISNTQLQGIQFSGIPLLIMVEVGLDFSRQLDSQSVIRHYQGFLK